MNVVQEEDDRLAAAEAGIAQPVEGASSQKDAIKEALGTQASDAAALTVGMPCAMPCFLCYISRSTICYYSVCNLPTRHMSRAAVVALAPQ